MHLSVRHQPPHAQSRPASGPAVQGGVAYVESEASLADENLLIERLAQRIRYYGCGQSDERIDYAFGHSGEGWYLGCSRHPDEGADFIAPAAYGALVVAQAIVAEERAALVAELRVADDARGRMGPVAFEAQLLAAGDAVSVAEACVGLDSEGALLLFVAEDEEARKAMALFRQKVRLAAGGAP